MLEIEGLLDAETVDRLRSAMRAGAAEAATVQGTAPERQVAPSARRSDRIEVAEETRAAVVGALEGLRPRIAHHFARALDEVEEPQFLRYGPGDYFVPHQDGNTPLIHDETRFRKVSVVIFLSAPAAYAGGDLVLHDGPPVTVAAAPGKLVAFPSETTHEVTPLTHGERLSVVSWYRGA